MTSHTLKPQHAAPEVWSHAVPSGKHAPASGTGTWQTLPNSMLVAHSVPAQQGPARCTSRPAARSCRRRAGRARRASSTRGGCSRRGPGTRSGRPGSWGRGPAPACCGRSPPPRICCVPPVGYTTPYGRTELKAIQSKSPGRRPRRHVVLVLPGGRLRVDDAVGGHQLDGRAAVHRRHPQLQRLVAVAALAARVRDVVPSGEKLGKRLVNPPAGTSTRGVPHAPGGVAG